MTRVRMSSQDRRKQLLDIAYAVADKKGILACTRRAVITKAKVSESLPNRHWTTVEDMRADVLREAVVHKNAALLRDAGAAGYELELLDMPRSLRREVNKK